MYVVQNMPPNTDHAHNKHIWTIIRNFSQVQVIISWWWILCDPKHVGVIFNVSFRLLYNKILTSTTVIIECIGRLIKLKTRWIGNIINSLAESKKKKKPHILRGKQSNCSLAGTSENIYILYNRLCWNHRRKKHLDIQRGRIRCAVL